ESPFRQHTLHVALERLESSAATGVGASPAESAKGAAHFEVVDDKKAALLEIRAKICRLFVGHVPPVDLDDIRDRIVEQCRIVGPDAVDVIGMRRQVADLL